MNNAPIRCPDCSAPLSVVEVLEACSVSVAGSDLLRLRCPRCGEQSYARVGDGRLELGPAAGEGGAGFRPTVTTQQPDLFVRREAAWVDCWHAKVYRRFPVVP